MMRKMMGVGVLAFGALASTASAQSGMMTPAPAGPSFGVLGGATFPVGDLRTAANTGYNVGGLVNFLLPPFPLGLRADVMYHRINYKAADTYLGLLGGDLNALFTVPMEGMVSPYLTGGVGFYHITFSSGSGSPLGSYSNTENKFALNGGAGLKFNLSGISTFVEARYLYLFTDQGGTPGVPGNSRLSMIPVSVGITFTP